MAIPKKYMSTALTSFSVLGMIFTTVLASKATIKAKEKLDTYCIKNMIFSVPKKEAIRLTWKYYLSTLVVGISTASCIIGVDVLTKKQQTSLISAYALLNESFKKHKNSVKMIFGGDIENQVEQLIIEKDYEENRDFFNNLKMNEDEVLCYDMFSKRYFTITLAELIDSQYQANRILHKKGSVSINHFYDFLGLEGIKMGDDIYWDENWIEFNNQRVELEDGMVCYVISADRVPTLF